MSIHKPGWPTSWPGSPAIRPTDRRTPAVELAAAFDAAKSGGVIVAAIAAVFTIGYIANMLGEDEDWLYELSIDMFPEDGCLRVYGVGEDGVTAFTRDGIECLQQIIADRTSCAPRTAAGQTGQIARPAVLTEWKPSAYGFSLRLG